jgi:hypothetical protein
MGDWRRPIEAGLTLQFTCMVDPADLPPERMCGFGRDQRLTP